MTKLSPTVSTKRTHVTRGASPRAMKTHNGAKAQEKTASDSLRASLDHLLAVEVERIKKEEKEEEERKAAEAAARRNVQRRAAAEEQHRIAQKLEARRLERQRQAWEEARIEAAGQEVLETAQKEMLERAEQSKRFREAVHVRKLATLKRDPTKQRLKASLATALLAITGAALALAFGYGNIQRTLQQETAALLEETVQTREQAQQEVERLKLLLDNQQSVASLERSQLEAELSAARNHLAQLEDETEARTPRSPPPQPAPRRLAQTESSKAAPSEKSDTSSKTIATAETTNEYCDEYDPMCFSL